MNGENGAAEDRLLLGREVSALLGVSVATVMRWAREGRIDCIKTPGGRRRYRESDIAALRRASDTAPGASCTLGHCPVHHPPVPLSDRIDGSVPVSDAA